MDDRHTTQFTVFMEDTTQVGLVRDAVVSQDEGHHDLATIKINHGTVEQVRRWKAQPALFEWSDSVHVREMYGYVDTVAMDEDSPVVHMLGMTNVCRNGRPRQWLKMRPFDIASEIIDQYRLGLEMDQYIWPLDSFVQIDNSDWQTLVRLGRSIGMSVISYNGVVKIVDVAKELSRAGRGALPRYRLDPSDTGAGSPASKYSFADTEQPVGADRFELSGIDRLGQTFSVSGGPPTGVLLHTEDTFQSLEEALNDARRRQDRDRLRQRAVITGDGLAKVTAGSAVYVAEENEGAPWYVTGVRHNISNFGKSYKTELTVQRPTRRSVAAPDRPNARPPLPVLRRGKWRLERQYKVEM